MLMPQIATDETELQRVRDRFEHLVVTGQYAMKRRGHKRSSSEMEADIPGTSKPFTRSATDRLSKRKSAVIFPPIG